MSEFIENMWYRLDRDAASLKPFLPLLGDSATHIMRSHGQTLVRLAPETVYAYDNETRRLLPETAHQCATICIIGHMSSGTSEAWQTADGKRSGPEYTLKFITDSLISRCERMHGARGDRVISRSNFGLIVAGATPEPIKEGEAPAP